MAIKWSTTQYQGVRYYEHNTRRTRNGLPDKYFAIRYYVNGRRREEGLEWASAGWGS